MATTSDIERYRANIRDEQESIALYQAFAQAEQDKHLAELYRRLAEVEQHHVDIWAEHLRKAGETVPPYTPTWRVRALIWIAQHMGVATVLPIVNSMEQKASGTYTRQPEVQGTTIMEDEQSHERIVNALQGANGTQRGITGPVLAQFEGRHRNTSGGNALRAAVLGASDGLTTSLSLVMGVAGANLSRNAILVTGFAGMLAGALSMAIGEWLSVQSARELYLHQIEVERQELRDAPEEEREELALIYQSKGLDEAAAQRLANNIMLQKDSALDTLAREELSIDPKELGGSALEAAITSFLLFASGAILPIIPFLFGNTLLIIGISVLLSVLGLFIIGVGITLTTGVPLLKAGGRQIALGLLAALITFGLGRLVGARLG